jgi:uncharacterized protein (TIGR02147 family)
MKKVRIFNYIKYLDYLGAVRESSFGGHGFMAKLAKAANCQSAFISQVFSEKQNLSLEQGFNIAKALEMDEHESNYFLLMINYARAGEKSLQDFYYAQLKKISEEQNDLKKRFKVQTELTKEQLILYYSDWLYPAVHIAMTIESLQSIQKISTAFNASEARVKKVLADLIEMGLIENKGEKYKLGNVRIHLEKSNPILKSFHTQFRHKAIEKIGNKEDKDDLNYTSLVSLSKKDFIELKESFVELIETYNKKVSDSKEECVALLNLDFMKY